MNRIFRTHTLAAISVILMTTIFPANGQEHVDSSNKKAGENIRFVFEVSRPNKPVSTYAVVSNGGEFLMDSLLDPMNSQESGVPPIVLHLSGDIRKIDASNYEIVYRFGMSIPFIQAQQSPRPDASPSYQYRDIGTRSSVSIKLDQEVELFEDPNGTLTLKLQRVNEEEYSLIDSANNSSELQQSRVDGPLIEISTKLFELDSSIADSLPMLDIEKLERMATGEGLIIFPSITLFSGEEGEIQMRQAEPAYSLSPSPPGMTLGILPEMDGDGVKYTVKLQITRRESTNGENMHSLTKELVSSGNAPLGENVLVTVGEISETQKLVALLKFDQIDPREMPPIL